MCRILKIAIKTFQNTSDVTIRYTEEQIMLFADSIILTLAVERVNLHSRIALRIIKLVGCTQRRCKFFYLFPKYVLKS